MLRKREKARMRKALRNVQPATVRELIEIAVEEQANNPWRVPHDPTHQPRAGTYRGRLKPITAKSFLEARSQLEQQEIAALVLLGRDALFTTAADFEAVCEVPLGCDIPLHLSGKTYLADYLRKALQLLEM